MTLYLWDASDYDWPRGPMDLHAARADGIDGFSYKATEATWIRHVHTGEALARARDAGIEFVGAYHVVRSTDPAEQVAYFLAYLDEVAPWWRDFPGFFLQVDLELWPYDAVTAATGKRFADLLVAAQPKRVITYASRGQYGDQLTGLGTPLWNASYGLNPVAHYPDAYPGDGSARWVPYSGQAPAFLQYGSQLRIGSQPGCDCSAFRGTVDDLRELIEGEDMDKRQENWLYNQGSIVRAMADGADSCDQVNPDTGDWAVAGAAGGHYTLSLAPYWAKVATTAPAPGVTPLTYEQTVAAAREGANLAEDS